MDDIKVMLISSFRMLNKFLVSKLAIFTMLMSKAVNYVRVDVAILVIFVPKADKS